MSTPAEKIAAQRMAFGWLPRIPRHKHLIGPDELAMLLAQGEELDRLKQAVLAATAELARLNQLLSGK